ncbi:zf-CHY-domain-containing protein [Neocallimastix lanati (nom. inval.)]|uniref:Zf-CHY-domain-containing protein n=1 Tax=Neocallimastix californiae TaxID=1754190 RepID=A0A1Y2C2D7_9FUNG|nr:zf-CHY-domain-containing protein [Neocallimastix sp. JGI-2020a]ORY41171.1 zf-CHY-domain-containing protein [Neocallimastix californiae]|eukprot:ORY41171.1 zf-CHY-domain-containing protein [Neocallimastix californiae]
MSDNECDFSFQSIGNYDDDDDEEEEESSDNNDNLNDNVESEEQNNINDEEEANKMNDEKLQKEQQNIRKQIINIQKDISLTETEKARKIQELMTRPYISKHKVHSNNITNFQPSEKVDYDRPLTEEEKAITYYNKEKNILGCKHYQRALKIQAHCCGKWFPCRFCHDEVSDHSITSKTLTLKMMCMYCSTVQPVNDVCLNANCGKKVARYYCPECKLWDNDPTKNIYHCYDCGICRIGKGLGIDYFHCKTCNVCMSISLKGHHKCIERNLESNCPICGEYMFTSTTTVIFMPCGHCIHHKCYKEYIQTSYQCPTCFKSLANMSDYFKRIDQLIAQQKMPEEYKNWKSYILCNDCEKKSYTNFHFIYHKCVYCSSYNTKLIRTFDVIETANLPVDVINFSNNNGNEH